MADTSKEQGFRWGVREVPFHGEFVSQQRLFFMMVTIKPASHYTTNNVKRHGVLGKMTTNKKCNRNHLFNDL